MMRKHTFCFVMLLLSALSTMYCAQNELPTVLTCTSNAKASRDYGFILEKQWMGTVGKNRATPLQLARSKHQTGKL
jgi:hypothetical protein